MMNGQVIENEKHFPLGSPNQPPKKRGKSIGFQAAAINHETQFPAIGNRRNHICGETPSGIIDPRSLSLGREASAIRTIRTQTGLVSPINLGLMRLRPQGDCGILLVQPFFDRLRLLFKIHDKRFVSYHHKRQRVGQKAVHGLKKLFELCGILCFLPRQEGSGNFRNSL